MKKLSFMLCTAGLLAGCGGTPMPTPEGTPAPQPEARRVPDVQVQLPALTDFPAQTNRLKAQASSLPAWTGEKLYEGYQQFGPELEVTNAGDVISANLRASTGGVYPSFIRVLNSVGGDYQELQSNGSGSGIGLAIDPAFYPGGASRKNAWIVRSSGGGDASSYTLNIYNRSFQEKPLLVLGPTSQELTIYNGINRDPSGSLDMEYSGGFSSIALLSNPPRAQQYVNIYEAGQAYGGDNTVKRVTPVLFPQDLTGFDPQKAAVDFTVGETNTFYVAMAFPAIGCADNACPSLINVQQVKDGKVQWSRVWKTEEPVKLRQITANKGEVILLTNSGSANPDAIEAQSQLTWISDAGDVFLRARVPLELWRRDWAKGTPEQQYAVIPNLKYIQSDDNGRLLLSNHNVIMTGTFSEGISNIYLLDEANSSIDRGDFSDVKFNGEYVYAAGTTRTNFGNPDPTGGNTKLFFLPLDFQLNER